jgi:hypothetical protein
MTLDRQHPTTHTRRSAKRLMAVTITAISVLAVSVSTSAAAGIGGPSPFGVTPTPTAEGQSRPYFNLNLAPGQSTTDTVIITNMAKVSETLKVSPSTGFTSPNSASAFEDFFRPCVGTGCWVTGLPSLVTLAAGTSQSFPFTVTVPNHVAPLQYLAGITAEPNTSSAPVVVGRNGQASAQAVVVDQVSVGVAVTVGALAHLKTALQIPAVTGGSDGPLPRIYVQLHNVGQTFTKAHGTAWCVVNGAKVPMTISSDTVLPSERAVLPINAVDIGLSRTVPCSVCLNYGPGLVATWSGTITTPRVAATKVIPTGPGTFSNLPAHTGVPTWAVVLIVIGALILVAMVATLLWMVLRRRRDEPRTRPPTASPAPL